VDADPPVSYRMPPPPRLRPHRRRVPWNSSASTSAASYEVIGEMAEDSACLRARLNKEYSRRRALQAEALPHPGPARLDENGRSVGRTCGALQSAGQEAHGTCFSEGCELFADLASSLRKSGLRGNRGPVREKPLRIARRFHEGDDAQQDFRKTGGRSGLRATPSRGGRCPSACSHPRCRSARTSGRRMAGCRAVLTDAGGQVRVVEFRIELQQALARTRCLSWPTLRLEIWRFSTNAM